MADDILTVLRSLANRWTIKARDYARASKEPGTGETQASYDRGFAEGYYKAATELALVIKELETAKNQAAPAPTTSHAPPPSSQGTARPAAARPAAPQTAAPKPAPVQAAEQVVSYLPISVNEALSVLEFAGTSARDITQNKDNSFRAVFSKWENMQPHERIERIEKADNRIVILKSGSLETHDHFLDFAFKDTDPA